MGKPQARIRKDGTLFYDRRELFNYVLDVDESMREKGIKTKIHLKWATDESYIFLINGKIIGQEHPGVPAVEGDAGDVPREYIRSTQNYVVKAPPKKKTQRPKNRVRSECNTHWIKR